MSLRRDKNVLKLGGGDIFILCEYAKNIELYTLNEWIVWCVSYISIKLLTMWPPTVLDFEFKDAKKQEEELIQYKFKQSANTWASSANRSGLITKAYSCILVSV